MNGEVYEDEVAESLRHTVHILGDTPQRTDIFRLPIVGRRQVL